ncbi:MAG: hypothetical protein HUK04_03405 [Bacteroidaceae bacterium]|nr:hypothetical protein [Bacteroidaceae bacterium]
MKKLFFLATMLLTAFAAFADEPFRLHRYDSFRVLPMSNSDVVFVGNSITDMHSWNEAWGSNDILNRGNSGAISSEILANVESYIVGQPKKLFLMIGTNDGMNSAANIPTTVSNIRKTLKRITLESPNTEVYVQSLLQSTNGRDLSVISQCNAQIKAMIESEYADKKVTYVNLYDAVAGITDGSVSFDKLHLTAAGYRKWMDVLTGMGAMDGYTCRYPANPANTYTGMAYNSFGMRSTYFANLPIKSTDILFIGDEMVKCGEWQELLGNPNVLNRGYGWGYAGPAMSNVLQSIPLIVSGAVGSAEPKQVVLYTGSQDVASSSAVLSNLTKTYGQIADKIRELCPNAKITLVSIAPTTVAAYNTGNITKMNEFMQQWAEADGNASYCDIFSSLIDPSTNLPNAEYMKGTYYVYGLGYAKIANLLASHIDGCNPITMEQAQANYDKVQARTALGNAIVTAEQQVELFAGFPAAAAVQALINEAYEALATGSKSVEEMNAMAANLIEKANKIYPAVKFGDLKTGWYQIKNVVGRMSTAAQGKFLRTMETGVEHTGGGLTLIYDVEACDNYTDLNTLFYLDYNAGSATVRLPNGYYIGKGCSRGTTDANTLTLTAPDTDQTAICFYNSDGTNYWDPFAKDARILLGASTASANCRFSLFDAGSLVEGHDIYTLVYDAEITDTPVVTYNKDGYTGVRHIVQGGVIILPSGEAPLAADFTSEKSGGMQTLVKVDAAAKTLTLVATGAKITSLAELAYARAAISEEVGAIADRESDTYQVLAGLVTDFKPYYDMEEAELDAETLEQYNLLKSTLKEYMDANVDNIKKPLVGHIYRFAVASSQKTQFRKALGYLTYAPGGTSIVAESSDDNLLECVRQEAGGRYVFKFTESGKYLAWRGGSGGENDNKGYVDAYDEEESYASFAIDNIKKTAYAIYDNVTMAGLVSVTSARRSTTAAAAGCFVVNDNAGMGWNAGTAPFFNGSYTSAFLITDYDIETGVTAPGSSAANAAIYNLSGQQVNTPARGIYITNGKKVVVK